MPLPTAPTGLVATASAPATGSGQASVALSWTANPSSAGIVEYRVYRTPTSWFMPKAVAAVVGTSCTDAAGELLANTGWYYFVVAVNAAGTSPASASASVTIPLPLPLPGAPSGLAATANGNDTVSLSWSANPASQGVTGYTVYRAASGSSAATLVATVSGTSYTDDGSALTAGSSWTYYLTATNAAGTSPASSSVTVTITAARFIAPFQVSNYGASPVSAGAPVTFAQPFAPGDVPSTNAIQIRAADGTAVLGSFQQDQESTWLQDGSTKCAALSFLAPDSFPALATITAITWAAGVVTVTAPNHGLPSAGGLVNIQNVAQQPYNGVFTYTYVDTSTFTYPLAAITFTANTTAGSTIISAVPDLGKNANGYAITASTIPAGAGSYGYCNGTLWSSQAASAAGTGAAFTLSPPMPATLSISDVMGGTHPATAALVVEYQLWSNQVAKSQAPNVTLNDITANSDVKLYFTDGAGLDYLDGDTWEVSVNDIVANGHGAAWNPAGFDQTGWAPSVSTTATATQGSNVITVASATGLVVGQYVVDNSLTSSNSSYSLPRGAQIATITGNAVTITRPAYSSATGVSVSFVDAPNRGWEVIRSGPTCTEFRFWSHLRNTATGAWHPYLKGFIYLRCWGMSGGKPVMEISGGWYQPNIFGKSPNSSVLASNPNDVYISTNNADDFVFAAYVLPYGANGLTAGAGWTLLPGSGQNSLITEYQVASSPLANEDAIINTDEGQQVLGLGDAIVPATAGVAPTLDGEVHVQGGFAGSTTATLSTNNANDVIVVVTYSYPTGGAGSGYNYPVTGISSPTIPASAWTQRKSITTENIFLQEWWAVSPSQLSNETITVNFYNGGGSSFSVDVFAVHGANTAAPFDTNAALPAFYPPVAENLYLMAATLYDGTSTLNVWGGTTDPRVTTVNLDASPSPVILQDSYGNGGITLSAAQYDNLMGQGGMRDDDSSGGSIGRIPVLLSVSSGGSLPGGLLENTVYWIRSLSESSPYDGFNLGFAPDPSDAWGNAVVAPYSNAGSGTMTITPLACSFPGHAGLALDPATAGRTWRNGMKPTLLAAHDFVYLTQKSRALPPYMPTIQVNKTPAYAPGWSQGSQYWGQYLGQVGQSQNDDRIGYICYHSTLELYRPFDIGYHQLNLGICGNWTENLWHYHDETAGLVPVNNVTQYPHLGAPQSNPMPWTIQVAAATQGTASDLDGGQDWGAGSEHSPSPQIVPYLKTADALWLESSLDDWFNAQKQSNVNRTLNGTTYYTPWNWVGVYDNGSYPNIVRDDIYGGGRGQGWCARTIGWAIHTQPANRPEQPFIRDMAAQDAQVPMLMVQNVIPPALQWSGSYCWINNQNMGSGPTPNQTFSQFATYMSGFMFMGYGMEAWRNEYPGWLDFIQNYYYRWCPGFFDDTAATNGAYPEINGAPPTNGCLFMANIEGTGIGFFVSNPTGWNSNWDQCHTDNAFVLVAWFDQVTITQGSDQIVGTGVVGGGIFQTRFVNGVATSGGSITGAVAYFPNYTSLSSISGDTVTLQAYPGEPGGGIATTGSGSNPVWVVYNASPVPWPGIAAVNADPVLSNQICFGVPNGAGPNNGTSYLNAHSSALALGAYLYNMTGNSVLSRCAAIYDEIRRRQGPGSGPWDENAFSLDNDPNFGWAPSGRTW